MLALLSLNAFAADVTWMPERLNGGASLKYSGRFETGYLEEDGVPISGRQVTEHQLDLGVEFAPVAGVSLFVDLSLSPSWRYRYELPRQMFFEPVDGGGSYLDGPNPETGEPPVDVTGGGVRGVWIGAAFAPFSESYAQNHRASWRFSAAYRFANKSNRWTINDGKRGGGPGSSAVRLTGAFSRRGGVAEPYVQAIYTGEGKLTADLTDSDGNVLTAGATLNPASTVALQGGTEIVSSENDASRTAVDVHLGMRYHTWEDVPSGILLPNVIDAGKSIPVTHSEHIQGFAGLGMHLFFSDIVRTSLGARFEYTLPHTQEHLYAVRTSADTFGVSWFASITATLGKDDLGTD